MKFEVFFWEADKTWTCPHHLLIETRYEPVLIFRGCVDDRDSYVPNWREWDAELRAICPCPAPRTHDFLWEHKVFASGGPVTFEQSNRIYYDLNHASTSPLRRLSSHLRDTFLGVRVSRARWEALGTSPIPSEWNYLYGNTNAAIRAREDECYHITVSPRTRRLSVTPPLLV